MTDIPLHTEPAFPCEVNHSGGTIRGLQTGNTSGIAIGLTKREYFAAMAMQGMLANPNIYDGTLVVATMCSVGQQAWQFADAVLDRAGLAEIEREGGTA